MTSIVITGSRDWPIGKAHVIWEALEQLWFDLCVDVPNWDTPDIEFHHGECPFGGADLIGASWAHGAGWKVIPHPPLKREGWAYAKRNQEMVDLKPDYVLAFFLKDAANKGTKMTYDMAVRAGIEPKEFWA